MNDDERRSRAAILSAYQRISLQECLVDGCQSKDRVIRAHSIQRAEVLETIALDGHVYMPIQQATGLTLRRVGINRATCFSGFCAEHDNSLFYSIDLGPDDLLDLDDPEVIVRLSLRSVAREYWAKLNSVRIYRRLFDLGKSGRVEEIQSFLDISESSARHLIAHADDNIRPLLEGSSTAAARIGRLFGSLMHQLSSGDFHYSKYWTHTFFSNPSVAVSSHFPIEFDLTGKQITSRKRGVDLAEATLNIVPRDSCTQLAFLWHRRFEKTLGRFFKQLEETPEVELKLRLSQMLIMHCENFAIAPRFYESKSEREQETILTLFRETLNAAMPYQELPEVSLLI